MAVHHPGPIISLWGPVEVLSNALNILAIDRTEGSGAERDEARAKHRDDAIAAADSIVELIQGGSAAHLGAIAGDDRTAWGFRLADTVRELRPLLGIVADRQFDGRHISDLQSLTTRLEAALGDLATARLVNAPPVPPKQVFVGDKMQVAIYHALDGRAMKKDRLAKELRVDPSQLYRPKGKGIKAMIASGHIAHHRTWGYYRPSSPPPEMVLAGVNQSATN